VFRCGNLELLEGRRDAALKRHERALEIRSSIVSIFGESPKAMSDVAQSEAGLARSADDPIKQRQHLKQALACYEKMDANGWMTAPLLKLRREIESQLEAFGDCPRNQEGPEDGCDATSP
jgi:hypothetical protein